MHVKTFVGPNPQAVLSLIKLEMGSEAVILSSRDTVRDGQRIHEVVAGVDRDPTASLPGAQSGLADSGDFGALTSTPPGWSEWHREWARVKEHLYTLMRPSMQWSRLSPRQRVALEFLQKEGVEDDVIFDMYKKLTTDGQGSILEILGSIVQIRPWTAENWKEAIHIIIGPFGSGKTSTLIRMALMLRRELIDIKIAVINGDCGRGAGRLALRRWSELSDFMYFEARDGELMRGALRAAGTADVIFIDMPGLDRAENMADTISEFGLAGLGAVSHLVLPPYFAANQMKDMIKRYTSGLYGSVIWSKLDESTNFSSLVNAAGHLSLPVSALSFGPGLRASFVPVSHAHMWKLLFKRQLPEISGRAN